MWKRDYNTWLCNIYVREKCFSNKAFWVNPAEVQESPLWLVEGKEGGGGNKLTRSASVFDVDWSLSEKLVHMFVRRKTEKISKIESEEVGVEGAGGSARENKRHGLQL